MSSVKQFFLHVIHRLVLEWIFEFCFPKGFNPRMEIQLWDSGFKASYRLSMRQIRSQGPELHANPCSDRTDSLKSTKSGSSKLYRWGSC